MAIFVLLVTLSLLGHSAESLQRARLDHFIAFPIQAVFAMRRSAYWPIGFPWRSLQGERYPRGTACLLHIGSSVQFSSSAWRLSYKMMAAGRYIPFGAKANRRGVLCWPDGCGDLPKTTLAGLVSGLPVRAAAGCGSSQRAAPAGPYGGPDARGRAGCHRSPPAPPRAHKHAAAPGRAWPPARAAQQTSQQHDGIVFPSSG